MFPGDKNPERLNASTAHSLDLLQVVVGVLIGHVGGTDVQLEVWPKVLKVVIVWEFCKANGKIEPSDSLQP